MNADDRRPDDDTPSRTASYLAELCFIFFIAGIVLLAFTRISDNDRKQENELTSIAVLLLMLSACGIAGFYQRCRIGHLIPLSLLSPFLRGRPENQPEPPAAGANDAPEADNNDGENENGREHELV